MSEGSFVMYTIKQVAEEFGVSDNTIRNWEKEFGDILNIQRDSNNNRYYIQEDIENFRAILHLREEGFGIAQIKKIFKTIKHESPNTGTSGVSKEDINSLKAMFNQGVPAVNNVTKEDLQSFQESIVQAIGSQFQSFANTINEMQLKIGQLDNRMQMLLEAPKEDSVDSLQKELANIKELQKSLQQEFQASETNELLRKQAETISSLNNELKEREEKFSQMVSKYREEVIEIREEPKKGFFTKLFGK
ncbi:helix-turn-helix domain-containing protein [Bacillus sp. FJAT-29937]|uniref:helix-turn-helix domain-containing protein n=1 Tax=Bacillus sp. FJAT-29937 TaxID=1720553 RepID=UPI00082A495A|nr:helix-turn-helix domain-containing protein [Bacillus sp. FJAT-29937]